MVHRLSKYIHYITLHSIALHYIPLHYITLDSIPLHVTFHYIPLHSITFHSIPFHSIPFHSIPFHYITFTYIPVHVYMQLCRTLQWRLRSGQAKVRLSTLAHCSFAVTVACHLPFSICHCHSSLPFATIRTHADILAVVRRPNIVLHWFIELHESQKPHAHAHARALGTSAWAQQAHEHNRKPLASRGSPRTSADMPWDPASRPAGVSEPTEVGPSSHKTNQDVSHNQNPVVKWSTQNHVKNEEGVLTNLRLPGF